MQKGEILQIEITSQGMNGEGVARVDGFVVFVPCTLVGEVVSVQVVYTSRSFARAKVIKIIKASKDRQTPPCEVYFKCGGCNLMHIKEELHPEIKRQSIINCFKKYANIDIDCNQTVCGKQLEYRNKAQLPIGFANGKHIVGYYKANSHTIVPTERCLLSGEWAGIASAVFLEFADKFELSVYDEHSKKGLLRHLVLRNISGHISVVVVINGDSLPLYQTLCDMLKQRFDDFSLHISINKASGNKILGDKIITLYGKNAVPATVCGVKTMTSPASFMQVNDEVRDLLYNAVKQLVKGCQADIVIDAYSGAGSLTNLIASLCDSVYGIEIVPEAVKDANAIAELNGNADKIVNVCGDAAVELPLLVDKLRTQQAEAKSIAVVLDPPRKGCAEEVVDAVLLAQPKTVIYISCNPATLARDCAKLLQAYDIADVTPFDMFPQTDNIECVVSMSRK